MSDAHHVGLERLVALGLRSIPKILTLQDRNPHSATYGCFDRNHWHLRITDFPSGMSQEFVLPLALAYAHAFDGNQFYRLPSIKDWIIAGIDFARDSSHPNGSCDDYYPNEKAAGAAAFSLLAITEAIDLLQLDPAPYAEFLQRRATWLGLHTESGRLSNHEALIANGLYKTAALTGASELTELASSRVQRLLTWQSDEGWFYEYQGCDPGYLTLTLANMAEIDAVAPDLKLRAPMGRAVRFLHVLQPPDGWLGGEWTSRNTNNFFPHGLELISDWCLEAQDINTRALDALRYAPEYDDDHILGHHSWSYLKAALNWKTERRSPVFPDQNAYWPEAGLAILRAGSNTLLTSTKKGGTFRLYNGQHLVNSDTGVSLEVRQGRKVRNYVCHLWNDFAQVTVGATSVEVQGPMGRAKSSRMTPLKNIVLRLLMLTIGRFSPDLVRRMLQRLLITGHVNSPFRFRRVMELSEDSLKISDEIEGTGNIISAGVGPAQTSIYTVMSRVYHTPQLQPWVDLTDRIDAGTKRLSVTRTVDTNA